MSDIGELSSSFVFQHQDCLSHLRFQSGSSNFFCINALILIPFEFLLQCGTARLTDTLAIHLSETLNVAQSKTCRFELPEATYILLVSVSPVLIHSFVQFSVCQFAVFRKFSAPKFRSRMPVFSLVSATVTALRGAPCSVMKCYDSGS
jgi:hypothetical protein